MEDISFAFFDHSKVDVNERPGRCSIEAALSRQLVMRDGEHPGHIYFPTRGYSMSAAEAIARGVMNQEAADIVAAQVASNKPAPFTRVDLGHEDDEKRKALDQAKAATPEGALLKAVQALILNPEGIEPQEQLLEALRVSLPELMKAKRTA